MKKLLIVVGSTHDLPLLSESKKLLKKTHIDFQVKVISCHRTLRLLVDELEPQKLKKENVGVIIAVAHSVANLPAIIAGYLKESSIHVIGVGVPHTDVDKLASLLSLLSIPSGIPLLTAGMGKVGLTNAALSAIKILKSH